MATYQILWWNEIPVGVRARDADGDVRVALHQRYQNAVDAIATATGRVDTTRYLEQWRWGEKTEADGPARQVAESVAADLERDYASERLRELKKDVIDALGQVTRARRKSEDVSR